MALSYGPGPTFTATTDVNGIGSLYQLSGKTYRWVRLVDQTGAEGEVVYPASATQWDVTTDFTGGSALAAKVCGVLLGAVTVNHYCFVQLTGIGAVRTDGGVAVGEALIGHSDDGLADTMADGEEELVFGFATATDGTTVISGEDSTSAMLEIPY